MYKYDSFEEYIQLNYLNEINDALQIHIKNNELKIPEFKKKYNCVHITQINITYVEFTQNHGDLVAFNVNFKADYFLYNESDKDKDNTILTSLIQKFTSYFRYPMKGSFESGFKHYKRDELLELDKEPEVLTSGIVPVIPNDEMEDYAKKFLKHFCPEALKNPVCLNIRKIFEEKGIEVYFAPLEGDVFGKIYFAKDKVTIYEDEGDNFISLLFSKTIEKEIEPGTILINFHNYMKYPYGAYRNTMIHEAVHWFFHRNYFELKKLLNEEETSFTCYKKDFHKYDNEDIAWMEYQARTLAPKILMPKDSCIKKWKELYKKNSEDDSLNSNLDIIERTLDEFRSFFNVSNVSAKIRLSELGVSEIDGVKNYVDGDYIRRFSYKKGFLKKNQTFILSTSQLGDLLARSVKLQQELSSGRLLYINKMLVVNNPKYVDSTSYDMTEYAYNHVDECCLVFDVERYGVDENGELSTLHFLMSSSNHRVEVKSVNSDQAYIIMKNADDMAVHFNTHKKYLPASFPETLQYHLDKGRENGIFKTYEEFSFDCDVSDRTLREYRNVDSSANYSRNIVLKICFALKLSAPYILDMLNKADCGMNYSNPENIILYTAIYSFPRASLEEMYIHLCDIKHPEILEMSNSWLSNHGF